MKFVTILILPMLLTLGGCAATSSVLPDVPQYTKAQQKEAAKEMKSCPCPVIWQMLGDYLTMRDETRALH